MLAGLLRRDGLDPDGVQSVSAAWQAFAEFLLLPVDGLESAENGGDGFMVQWGRFSWNDRLPSLAFTREFAVDVRDTWAEQEWYQPEIWQVTLDMVFLDTPRLADLGQSDSGHTIMNYSAPGPDRGRAIRAVEQQLAQYPAVQVAWASSPVRSRVTLDDAG
jgi:hypothetical protein